jgi:hypothetical protein
MDKVRGIVPGHLHTPTQSFSDSPASATPEYSQAKNLILNDKKFKEECDHIKSRLTDQKFDIRE